MRLSNDTLAEIHREDPVLAGILQTICTYRTAETQREATKRPSPISFIPWQQLSGVRGYVAKLNFNVTVPMVISENDLAKNSKAEDRVRLFVSLLHNGVDSLMDVVSECVANGDVLSDHAKAVVARKIALGGV